MTVRGLISVPLQSSSAVVPGLVAIVIWPTPLTPVAAPIVTPFEKVPSGIRMWVLSTDPVGGGVVEFNVLLMMIPGSLVTLIPGGAACAPAGAKPTKP